MAVRPSPASMIRPTCGSSRSSSTRRRRAGASSSATRTTKPSRSGCEHRALHRSIHGIGDLDLRANPRVAHGRGISGSLPETSPRMRSRVTDKPRPASWASDSQPVGRPTPSSITRISEGVVTMRGGDANGTAFRATRDAVADRVLDERLHEETPVPLHGEPPGAIDNSILSCSPNRIFWTVASVMIEKSQLLAAERYVMPALRIEREAQQVAQVLDHPARSFGSRSAIAPRWCSTH